MRENIQSLTFCGWLTLLNMKCYSSINLPVNNIISFLKYILFSSYETEWASSPCNSSYLWGWHMRMKNLREAWDTEWDLVLFSFFSSQKERRKEGIKEERKEGRKWVWSSIELFLYEGFLQLALVSQKFKILKTIILNYEYKSSFMIYFFKCLQQLSHHFRWCPG
jgi:hypothetical protein